jgi:malate dehydrogenase (oxaloacetate-decarboxylating)
MKKFDAGKESLVLHKKARGKIEVVGKVPVRNRKELSVAYTPGIGAVSSAVAANPELAFSHTIKGNTVAVVSDGSAVLGLGNLGALGALPVMEGKALLFKQFAGVDAFPICLDTQDTEEIIRTVKAIAPSFGGINLEDISAPRCFEVERRLRAELSIPVMHDDQHGTATVVLAGLINALKLRKTKKESAKVVINGAGAAGTSIAKILVDYGFKYVVLCDSKGVVTRERGDINKEKEELVSYIEVKAGAYYGKNGTLMDALVGVDIFVGVSKAGALTPEMVQVMAPKPIIFGLANPVPEIMPDIAKKAGAFVVATGRSDFPNQLNNVLAFPGLFRGALDARVQFEPSVFVRAAEAIAKSVKKLTVDTIIPDPFDVSVPKRVAQAVKKGKK